MTRDEVLAMAHQVGLTHYVEQHAAFDERLERFAALALEAGRKAEREECAKVAEIPVSGEQDDITRQACDGIAKRIRARSDK